MKWLSKLYLFRNKLIMPYVRMLLLWADGVLCFMSLIFLLASICKYGFSLTVDELSVIEGLINLTWIVYLVVNTLHLVFNFQEVRQNYRKMAWILNFLLYLTLLPFASWNFLPEYLTVFLRNSAFTDVLLLLLSLLNLSNALIRLFGKRTNPSLIFASSFLILIVVGTGLLLLPKSTYDGISFIDALFTSTSAVCVTGLSTVDVSTVFTPTGQLFILILIQIGGLGVMTITSFFALFFMGNTSIYNQLAVKDMVSSQSLSSLLSTLLYILGFTLVIEALGALWLYAEIHGTMGMTWGEELFFVAFHAVSAFCNAGFSTLSGNLGNEQILHHTGFYLGISFLIILGGIGYPILVNFYQTLSYEVKRVFYRLMNERTLPHRVHLYNLNTRIVVRMTAILLISGTFVILIAEWNRAFAGMSVVDKFVQAFFNAVSPRTAGFNSVSLTTMGFHSLLFYMLLMMIGGGAQSTAGGMKVNAFAVILLNLRAVLKNAERISIFNRELSYDSIRRSNATLIFYLLVVFVSFFFITLLEPDLPAFSLLFECVSALSTVGSSLDLTPLLGNGSKLLLVLLMFVGRVGLLTLVASLVGESRKQRFRYPSDHVIIN
ncbi:MAG: potassium transporter [Bacteroidaceae bacterium]|nr:potassium transporter [Bacteroidaceae bacterium]MBQ4057242.1 potassium transporter [Bacteroidaceae bacterium]